MRSVILKIIPFITNANWISNQLKNIKFDAIILDYNKPKKTEIYILFSLKYAGTRSLNVRFPGEYKFLVQ
ncbi:hypothetical protein PoMZ_02522 [Pyricularia oryzae]|uniref:Uncharacterized protein n=1 Tax=Pyricularia oryzae TaxID=318829 RepID=A0A4P7N8J3_PYROR|nr:hypothetical protein PoMZ_02522 [Pyricularia oryzae]